MSVSRGMGSPSSDLPARSFTRRIPAVERHTSAAIAAAHAPRMAEKSGSSDYPLFNSRNSKNLEKCLFAFYMPGGTVHRLKT